MCAMLRSTRARDEGRPDAQGKGHGFTGRSAEPNGVDFVTLPSSLVGEYWPLVRP